jgi:programmed cell death protein 5
MDDPELEAIRRARMAELQGGRGGGGSSSGGYAAGGMGRGGGNMGDDGGKQQEQMAAQEEMKRQALSTILDPEARERCECKVVHIVLSVLLNETTLSSTVARIAMVKPSKAKSIQDLLIRMAQSGQVRQKVTEQQLIGLLDQVDGPGQGSSGGTSGAGKITVSILLLVLRSMSSSDCLSVAVYQEEDTQ